MSSKLYVLKVFLDHFLVVSFPFNQKWLPRFRHGFLTGNRVVGRPVPNIHKTITSSLLCECVVHCGMQNSDIHRESQDMEENNGSKSIKTLHA